MTIFCPHHEIRTLVDLLRWRAQHCAKQLAYVFVTEGVETARLTYEDLDRQSRVIGGFLQNLGETGSRVLLLYPPGLDYIAAFFGCLYAGAVAIPSYPPRLNRPDVRLQGIVNDSQASIALTLPSIRAGLERRFEHTPELAAVRWEVTDRIEATWQEKWRAPEISRDTLAFLQYTSGSTSTPKGVMVTHSNILHNERMIQQGFEHTAESVVAGWLPIYHDMGLIGNVIQPLYVGTPCYLMSPTEFLQTPYRWLKLISDTRAHTSGGPNFAYDLCTQMVTPEQRQTLDLSHWQVAFNGSEPVRAQTLARFGEAFASCGFRPEAFYPCYGLAETTLFVSGRKRSLTPIQIAAVEADGLAQNQVKAALAEDVRARKLVSSGGGWLDEEIVIVNPEKLTRCAPDGVGEIWLRGSHVAPGYWQRPEVNRAVFEARLADTGAGLPYLRTGDLGFLQNGELFVTGRLKDLLIIRGRNHYPQDIELTVERSHPSLRPGGGAAFSIEIDGEERLAVVHEVERHAQAEEIEAAVGAIRRAVADQHELQTYAILLIRVGTLPKTSSGKVQRRACRDKYLENSLIVVKRHILEAQTAETPLRSDESGPAAQLSPAEKKLAAIWTEVLQLKQVGIHDNFFELGGDSLLVMRVIAKAHPAGLHFTHQDFFEYPTIAELALRSAPLAAQTEQETMSHDLLPLTVAQSWFFGQRLQHPNHWNQTKLIEMQAGTSPQVLEQIVRYLWTHHDGLRARFVQTEAGWRQTIIPADQEISGLFSQVDFSALAVEKHTEAIERAASAVQEGLSITDGPLMQVVFFDLGEKRRGRLLIVLHHLVYDGASTILLDDFSTLFQQIKRDEPLQLPAKTTPIWRWLERLGAYTESAALRQEHDYWLSLPWKDIRPLPVDLHNNMEKNTWGSSSGVLARLSEVETQVLVREIPKAYNVQLMDVLIAALVQTVTKWSNNPWLLLDTVDFGRNAIPNLDDLDLSRTLGWFSIHRHLVLRRGDCEQPEDVLKALQTQLRNMPNRGLGYELLLYGGEDKDIIEKLQQFPVAEIALNYDSYQYNDANFTTAYEYTGPTSNLENRRSYVLDCSVQIMDGRLIARWIYGKDIHKQATIKNLAEGYIRWLQMLIAGYTSGK